MPRRILTPAEVTEKYPNPRTGRTEAWTAVSKDRKWLYIRIEDTGTTWEIWSSGRLAMSASSLRKARRATADGRADAALARLAVPAPGPAVPDPHACPGCGFRHPGPRHPAGGAR